MASLRTIPAGTPLMRVGETDREMYVIVDGALRVWKEGPTGRSSCAPRSAAT